MKRTLIFGLIIASLSSAVIGFFLNYFYAFGFDETVKILPIWKVVFVYFLLGLSLSLLAYFVESKWKNGGLPNLGCDFEDHTLLQIRKIGREADCRGLLTLRPRGWSVGSNPTLPAKQ